MLYQGDLRQRKLCEDLLCNISMLVMSMLEQGYLEQVKCERVAMFLSAASAVAICRDRGCKRNVQGRKNIGVTLLLSCHEQSGMVNATDKLCKLGERKMCECTRTVVRRHATPM